MADKGGTGPLFRQEPSLPQVFGRYLLVQRLSRGGMGEIFLAKHGLAGFEKLAVIKKVLPHLAADAQFISRFVDEAQVAIKLQHVNVAQVFEVGRVGDEYFLALEYVEGRDLRRTLALLGATKQRLPVDLGLFIGRELANGLAYAHRRTTADGAAMNLVHCDISPPNVLVSFEGETKVIDFGIAKSAMRGTATDPKMGFGKFGYMAPEQLIRGGMVDHRTDIYAAGVVLFELLTGQRLYEAGPEPDYRALAKKVAKGEHNLPSDVDKALGLYDDLVATALRPKLEDRYQSAAEFRDAIQQCLVAVNPTISTDQLGAYMRELFADEMTAQRELHDKVASAHLEDFQDQLTSQTVSTVSFALARLPLKAPELPPPTPPRPRMPTTPPAKGETPRAPTAPTDVRPALPPAPAAASTSVELETSDLSLADGTGTVKPEKIGRSKTPLVLALSAAIVIVGGIVFAMTRTGGDAPRSQTVAAAPQPRPQVEPIPLDEQDPPISAAGTVNPGSAAAPPAPVQNVEPQQLPVPPPPLVHNPSANPPHGNHGRHEPKHVEAPGPSHAASGGSAAPKAGIDRKTVGIKFQALSHDYDAYKVENGPRLDKEWGDLTTFITYQLRTDNLDEAVRRIDAFRARMHD